jgi:hypothetical protein
MSESEVRSAWQERRLEEVLMSSIDPMSKVRQIMGLGFSEDMAEEVVTRYQSGQQAPVYYERLDFLEEVPEDNVDAL